MDRVSVFFFFQAEDGIRDLTVTGVQTCALPICLRAQKCVNLCLSFGGLLTSDKRVEPAQEKKDFAFPLDLRQGFERRFQKDRKSTRLNSSHSQISYAVFCLKKRTQRCPPSSRATP